MSRLNFRVRDNGILPGKDIEEYIVIKDQQLKQKYNGQNKIPMQVFHDAYFEGKIDIKGKHSVLSNLSFLFFIMDLTRVRRMHR